MRARYEVTIVTFLFHICLILVPIFLLAHIAMFEFAWGLKWGSLSQVAGTYMTIIVVLASLFS